MGGALIGAFLGWLPHILAQIIGIPVFILLEGLILLAEFFSQFWIEIFPSWVGLVSGLFVISFFVWGSFSRKFEQKYLDQSLLFDK